jgi:hypothetical protein
MHSQEAVAEVAVQQRRTRMQSNRYQHHNIPANSADSWIRTMPVL